VLSDAGQVEQPVAAPSSPFAERVRHHHRVFGRRDDVQMVGTQRAVTEEPVDAQTWQHPLRQRQTADKPLPVEHEHVRRTVVGHSLQPPGPEER
jgi:hypothetical protein